MHRKDKAKNLNVSSKKGDSLSFEQNQGAIDLAQLIYDTYKERQENDKIEDGQNNANQSSNDYNY